MRPFLERLAHRLLEQHPAGLDRIAVVLPGKRAGLHLRKYLAKANGKALWSPEMLDMGAFYERTTGLAQGGAMELVFLLYEAHRRISGERPEPFGEFLEWAPTSLRDMSEVDAHLIDHLGIYRDLREFHELEEWSFRLGTLSPGQERLNRQWRATGELHTAFTALMNERRTGTSGHLARACADAASAGTLQLPWTTVWFAGLNALDPASTAVIDHLKKIGTARIAWDADPFYLSDTRQEAGRYLRRSIATLGMGELPPQPGIMGTERTIRKVAAPHPFSQATYVAQRLSELPLEERARTAVVLADENLLLPLLEQLPADIGPLNVTMGMPLKALPVSSLADAFLELLHGAFANGHYAIAQLEAFIGHPFLNEGPITTRTILALRNLQQARITLDALLVCASGSGSQHVPAMALCMAPFGGYHGDLQDRFNTLFSWALKSAPTDRAVHEQLFQMARLQQRLHRLLDRGGTGPLDLPTYTTIRTKLLRDERIAFLGEPLRGLQVMGLLETRAVDHEHLIMVSLNEGVLPRAAAQQTWIPFDLRSHYKLPVSADGEAISAYHFQRAMQLAGSVEWVHGPDGGTDASGPSRFVAQWEHEVIGRSQTQASSHVVSAGHNVRRSATLCVVKDTAVMQRLDAICAKGLSPSALGTWLRCPLDFHLKYVLGIRETDVPDGTLGSDVLGDAVHHVLQELLTPFIGERLTPENIRELPPQIDQLLVDKLALRFPRTSLDHGHFKLRREMATKALATYLIAEQSRCETSDTRVLAIEKEVQGRLSNGVLLKGRCDRIDLRNGHTVILDMKTGAVRPEDLRLTHVGRDAVGPAQRYALQLMIYAWAYLEQHREVHQVKAGIIPLQQPTMAEGEFLKMGGNDTFTRVEQQAAGALLSELVNELLDPEKPFVHDPESRYCKCCVA